MLICFEWNNSAGKYLERHDLKTKQLGKRSVLICDGRCNRLPDSGKKTPNQREAGTSSVAGYIVASMSFMGK